MAGIGAGGPRALGVCLCQRFSVNRGAEHCHRARETKKTAACCVWVNDPPRPSLRDRAVELASPLLVSSRRNCSVRRVVVCAPGR